MNSRPLPYQGSALPLSYASLKKPTLQSYRERIHPSMTRKAKNPNRIQVSFWYLPGSIVCQTRTANTPRTASAITIRPLPAGLRSKTLTNYCKLQLRLGQTYGAQGRIRTSVAHNAADLQSAAINHSATCAHPAFEFQASSIHLGPSSPSTIQLANRAETPTLKECPEVCRARTVEQYNQIHLSFPAAGTGAGEGT